MNNIDLKKIAALVAVHGLKAELNLEGLILRGQAQIKESPILRAARVIDWDRLAEDAVGTIEAEAERLRIDLFNHYRAGRVNKAKQVSEPA